MANNATRENAFVLPIALICSLVMGQARAENTARVSRVVPMEGGTTVTLGSFKFDSQLFGDGLLESDSGMYSSANWLNVQRVAVGNPEVLTGPSFDTGIGNIGLKPGLPPVYTIGYQNPVQNGPGPDLGIISARYSANDTFDITVSTDGTTFSNVISFGPATAVSTGETRAYYYGPTATSPEPATLFVTPVDLSAFGIPAGDSIRALTITGYPEADLIRVAGYDRRLRVEFDIPATATERVLAGKYGQNDSYLSALQGAPSQITIAGTVRDPQGATVGGVPVYLRVLDPPDTALYVPASLKKDNDNADPVDQSGANLNARLSATTATTDASGRFSVTLYTSDTYAGDNYRVQASFASSFPCAPPSGPDMCAKTGLIEVWKRMYLEVDRMFRTGGVLTVPAPVGSTQLTVSNLSGFKARKGNTPGSAIRLVHAPRIPGDAPYFEPAAGEPPITVETVNKNARTITLSRPISKAYVTNQGQPWLSDGVGVVTGVDADDFYLPNATLIANLFREAFVDTVMIAPTDPGECRCLPFYGDFSADENIRAQQLVGMQVPWFENSQRYNHFQIIGGSRAGVPLLGVRIPPSRSSWVFVDRINSYHGINRSNLNAEATAHEHTHSWDVNPVGGHCAERQYANASHQCLMHVQWFDSKESPLPEYYDGRVALHYLPTGVNRSEYVTIRQHAEPLQ